jgi:hypothetical protein
MVLVMKVPTHRLCRFGAMVGFAGKRGFNTGVESAADRSKCPARVKSVASG